MIEHDLNRNEVVSRWLSELKMAELLGSQIQLKWRQSNYDWAPICNLNQVYLWPAR